LAAGFQGRSIGASAWARPVLESTQWPNFTLRIIPATMTQTDADKFLKQAEECLQQAERAISTRDKRRMAAARRRMDETRAYCQGKGQIE
jgi:hypothetical protein